MSRVVLLHGWPGDPGDWRRVAQALARRAPEKVRALVLAPPFPGAGDRVLSPEAQREFWYQAFHQLEPAEQLRRDAWAEAIRAHL